MQQKKCTKCKKTKDLEAFFRRKVARDNRASWCKLYSKELTGKYFKSKVGVITVIYNSQKFSSLLRCYDMPNYSRGQLIKWCMGQDLFHELYDNWVKSNYNRHLKPSVDRINDYKSYTFNNIQLMAWCDHQIKSNNNIRNGINVKQSKTVLQFNLDGNFIKEYYSANEAQRQTKISHIPCVCRGDRPKAGGFKWEYKN